MVARVIALVNQKGGVGKSTVALNLGAAFAQQGRRVLIVDCDAQQTALRICADAPPERPFPAAVIGLAAAEDKLGDLLRPHLLNYDYVLIDGPPSKFSKVTRAAVALADVVLLPTLPAKQDLLSTAETAELFKELEARLDRALPAYVLLNQTENTRVKRMVDDLLSEYLPYPALRTQVRKRTSYREAAALGRSIFSTSDKEAASDMSALRDEVTKLIKKARTHHG